MAKLVINGNNFDELSAELKRTLEESEARFKDKLNSMFEPPAQDAALAAAPKPAAPPAPEAALRNNGATSSLASNRKAHEAYGRLRTTR